ncbi:hemerythrin domain-containing protein [Leekyejoonella antrihumi]|uniref:Hemerythrin domain-containing protein n=1 Tax=Leekyejoonella antrihumi TaxID=1660198 RepID=A0A563E1J9_9MICO|nr:hemerythrin domain-containing protein [Leekyejoonella antrihumi]TWP36052.1 hemerythrin domain-containing protein [Leekyejoonella antrihumi]
MEQGMLAAALEREHHEIDGGIETFVAAMSEEGLDTSPLTAAMEGLRRHIYLEEEFVFPALRAGGMVAPVFVMLREHGQLWATLDLLAMQLKEDPRSSVVYELCDQLLGQLDAHNTKEEPIIYPQVDAALDDATTARLTDFLDSGSMPDGWVCERTGA